MHPALLASKYRNGPIIISMRTLKDLGAVLLGTYRGLMTAVTCVIMSKQWCTDHMWVLRVWDLKLGRSTALSQATWQRPLRLSRCWYLSNNGSSYCPQPRWFSAQQDWLWSGRSLCCFQWTFGMRCSVDGWTSGFLNRQRGFPCP